MHKAKTCLQAIIVSVILNKGPKDHQKLLLLGAHLILDYMVLCDVRAGAPLKA